MAVRTQSKKIISGPFIHNDEKLGNVYYDIFTRKGYVILNKDVDTYRKFISIIFIIIVLPFFLVQVFSFSVVKAFAFSLVVFLIVLIIFKTRFIYKLSVIENYVPSKKQRLYITLAEKLTTLRLVLSTIAAFLTSILLAIYTVIEKYEGLNLILLYIVAIVLLILTIKEIVNYLNRIEDYVWNLQ